MEQLKIGSIIQLKELENRRFLISKKCESGFGIVYFLKSLSDFPNCAMKMFKQKVSFEDVEKEAFAWAQLGTNKNIASFICFGNYQETPYILSLRYQATLESLIEKEINEKFIKQLFYGVVDGLKYANSKLNLIHRDIKPGNIFLDGNIAKVGDFGIASFDKFDYKVNPEFHSYEKYSERTNEELAGTYPFMAPELFLTEKPDFNISTDIFALGVTFFLLFSGGLLPYDLKNHLIITDAFNKFNRNCKDEKFRNIILKCIDLTKNNRFKNYDEITMSKINTDKEDSISEIINTIQLLRRENKIEQALEYAKEELKNNPKHPLIVNQIAIIYTTKRDDKTFEFILSDFFDNYDYTSDLALCMDSLFTLANYYFKTENSIKFKAYIKKFEKFLKEHQEISWHYPEYGIYLALNLYFYEAYEIFITNIRNINLPPKYWLFFCCICQKTNHYKELKDILKTKSGEFEQILIGDISSEIKFEELIKQCRNNYKGFMDVLF